MKRKAMQELVRRIIKRNLLQIFIILFAVLSFFSGAIILPITLKCYGAITTIYFAILGGILFDIIFVVIFSMIYGIYTSIKKIQYKVKKAIRDWKNELAEIEEEQQRR